MEDYNIKEIIKEVSFSMENKGYDSVVFGYSNKNYGDEALVTGLYNKNNNQGAIIAGKYNDNKDNTLFEIGNGIGEDITDAEGNITTKKRKNAFEVYKDGHATVQKTTDNNTDVVNVAYMKQYIKDHFAELMSEYLAENTATAEDISTIFNANAGA